MGGAFEGGAGLVEGDVSVGPQSPDRKVNPSVGGDESLIAAALRLRVPAVASGMVVCPHPDVPKWYTPLGRREQPLRKPGR